MTAAQLQLKLDDLLQADLDDMALLAALQKMQQSEPKAFTSLAETWAPALYERDPFFFSNFLAGSLSADQIEVVDALLHRLEADGYANLFLQLYQKIASPQRWNADVRAITRTSQDYAALRRALDMRGSVYNQWVKLEEETALALYHRGDAGIRHFIERCISQGQITDGESFTEFRSLMEADGQEDLYWATFRATATPEDWYAELRNLAKGNLTEQSVTKALRNRQVRHGDAQEVPDDILFALIEQYGESLLPYLERNNRFFARHSLNTLFSLRIDNTALLRELMQLRNRHYQLFPQLAKIWAPALYDRDPVFFEKFLVQHLNRGQSTLIRELLPRIKSDGHDSLYRALYGYIAETDEWNAQILTLAQSDLPDARFHREMDLLDIPTTYYYRRTKVGLSDEAAAALYQRAPWQYQGFIQRYIQADSLAAMPKLVSAIQQNGDDAFYWEIFRQTANHVEWQKSLDELLKANSPPEQINAELEKRHPTDTKRVQPGILSRFASHYGEAVMAYFEKHLQWATPERITRLLALDLERGTLRRELEIIARREPLAFTLLAHIWAPAIYQSDSDFFDGFLRRYLGARDVTIRHLLPKIEADGKDKLFTALYPRVVTLDEWNKHVEVLAESAISDEALLAALERRNIAWYMLTDRTTVALYKRTGQKTGPLRTYLLNHVSSIRAGNYHIDYAQLRQHAEEVNDTVLLARISDSEDASDGRTWGEKVTRFLTQDMPAGELLTALKAIQPPRRTQTDTSAIFAAMAHYGKAILPYLHEHGQWVGHNLKDKARFFEEIIALGDLNLYQKLFFSIADAPQWNKTIQNLLNANLDENDFFFELALLTPPGTPERSWRWRWYLQDTVAVELYTRYPKRSRPFLERHLEGASEALFALAEANDDQELLDFMTYKQLERSFNLVLRAYPPPWSYYSAPDKEAGTKVEKMGELVCQRFDRLYAQSPEAYVRHTANILSKVPAFGIIRFEMQLRYNPIMQYIAREHHDTWHTNPDGIRELLESPDIYVQLLALDILQHGKTDAAARVLENLPTFRVLLLGRMKINTKKQALACLEHAAQQGQTFAVAIIALLEELLDFRGKRAITEQIMVVLVRLKRQYGALTP